MFIFSKMNPLPQPPVVLLEHPVVLMHGFGAVSALFKKGSLHSIAMGLRQHGLLAFAPNIQPYDTIEQRAYYWQQHCQSILQQTGAKKLHLIAHSMAGLDARYLISHLEGHNYIASLTTISTPHQGTYLANFILKNNLLKKSSIIFMHWIGHIVCPYNKPVVNKAIEMLTPEYVKEIFNPQTPDHPDILYFSYFGHAGRESQQIISPFLWIGNEVIYQHQGKNDGVVPCNSAYWGEFIQEVAADHFQLSGLQFGLSKFDSLAFHVNICKHLSEKTKNI